MKHDDDFISRLLNETYKQVEHPSNELSNQSVITLSDYFNERQDVIGQTETTSSSGISVNSFNSFLRINVKGQELDIPQGLDWVSPIESFEKSAVYELRDETLSHLISDLCGKTVKYIIVEEKSVEVYEQLPEGFIQAPKAA